MAFKCVRDGQIVDREVVARIYKKQMASGKSAEELAIESIQKINELHSF